MSAEKYTTKERLGIALERWILAILKALFPTSEGFRILTPNWQNYNNHHGVDFRIFKHKAEVLALECKNWRRLTKKYGSDIAQTEIIERFQHIGTNLKLCIISFKDVLTEPSLREIKANGIQILDVSKLVGYKDFKSSLFGEVLRKLASIVKEHANRAKVGYCYPSTRLDSYVSKGVDVPLSKTIPISKEDHETEPKERFPYRERFPHRPRFEDRNRFS